MCLCHPFSRLDLPRGLEVLPTWITYVKQDEGTDIWCFPQKFGLGCVIIKFKNNQHMRSFSSKYLYLWYQDYGDNSLYHSSYLTLILLVLHISKLDRVSKIFIYIQRYLSGNIMQCWSWLLPSRQCCRLIYGTMISAPRNMKGSIRHVKPLPGLLSLFCHNIMMELLYRIS